MINKTGEQNIYLDKGFGKLENERFVNQIALSSVASFVPAPIAADINQLDSVIEEEYAYELDLGHLGMHRYAKYPVEKVGGPQWQQVLNAPETKFGKETITFSFKENILVAQQVLEQLKYLWENFAVIIGDRNGMNIVLERNDNLNEELKWSVYQIDLEFVYDALHDTYNIGQNEILRDRIDQVSSNDFKYSERSLHILSNGIKHVLSHITDLTTKEAYGATIPQELKQLITSFSNEWDLNSHLEKSKNIDFETAFAFLNQLLTEEKSKEVPSIEPDVKPPETNSSSTNSLFNKIKNLLNN